MYRLMNLFHTEPAVLAGIVQAILALAVLFGLPLTPEQLAGVEGVLAMVLGIFYVRPKVTPLGGPQ